MGQMHRQTLFHLLGNEFQRRLYRRDHARMQLNSLFHQAQLLRLSSDDTHEDHNTIRILTAFDNT